MSLKINNSEIKTIINSSEDNYIEIEDNLLMNTDISEYKLEKILEYFKEHNLTVGMLTSIEVEESERGQGVGRKLMNYFEENIITKTDVDILIARKLNKQNEGFDLELFYEKYGFEGLLLEDGDLLMVTKGYRSKLDNYLDLKTERDLIKNWFEKNQIKNEKQRLMFEFANKRIKETEPNNKKRKRLKLK